MTHTYAMTDGVTDEEFNSVVESAKHEGNLSRANVVRKVRGLSALEEPARRSASLPQNLRKCSDDPARCRPPWQLPLAHLG